MDIIKIKLLSYANPVLVYLDVFYAKIKLNVNIACQDIIWIMDFICVKNVRLRFLFALFALCLLNVSAVKVGIIQIKIGVMSQQLLKNKRLNSLN